MAFASKKDRRGNLGAMMIIAVAAFSLAQIFGSIHEAKFGDAPHDHMGQACVLALAAPGGDKFVPISAFAVAAMSLMLWRMNFASPQAALTIARIHALRSRGPPSQ